MKYNDFQFPTGAISVVSRTDRDLAIELGLNLVLKDGREALIYGYEFSKEGYRDRYFNGSLPEFPRRMEDGTLKYVDAHMVECEAITASIRHEAKNGTKLFFIDTLLWMPLKDQDPAKRPDLLVSQLLRVAVDEGVSVVLTDTYPAKLIALTRADDLHNGRYFAPVANLVLAGRTEGNVVEVRAVKSRDSALFSWDLIRIVGTKALVAADE